MAGSPKKRAKRMIAEIDAKRAETAARGRAMTNAERQRAYRERRKLRAEAAQQKTRGDVPGWNDSAAQVPVTARTPEIRRSGRRAEGSTPSGGFKDSRGEGARKGPGAAVAQLAEPGNVPEVPGSIPGRAPEAEQCSQPPEGGLSAAAQPPARNVVALVPVTRPRNTSGGDAAVTAALDAQEDAIVEALSMGEWPTAIAAGLGVKARELTAWIEADEDRARACTRATEMAAAAKLAEAEKLLREAKTGAEVYQAERLANHLRWVAARLDSRRFGEKVDLTSGGKPLARPIDQVDAELAKILGKVRAA